MLLREVGRVVARQARRNPTACWAQTAIADAVVVEAFAPDPGLASSRARSPRRRKPPASAGQLCLRAQLGPTEVGHEPREDHLEGDPVERIGGLGERQAAEHT